jgi:starch-binding outer membrane protein, SusD/RagB family
MIKGIKFKNTALRFFILIFLCVTCFSCKKLVEVDPPYTSVNAENIFSSEANSIALLTSVYGKMSQASILSGGITSVSVFTGLSSDELTLYSGAFSNKIYLGYYQNSLLSSTTGAFDIWVNIYPLIYTINFSIKGLSNNEKLSRPVRDQLLGEAKFVRAFFDFYLVNLYKNIPLVLTEDYQVNSNLQQSSPEDIYKQIIADLNEAINLLSSKYLDKTLLGETNERVRPTKWVASSLLARVYLYLGNYSASEVAATSVISNSSMYLIADSLNGVFLKSSPEAIWQLQPVNSGWNTSDAQTFVITANGFIGSNPVYISDQLLNAFEADDQRQFKWLNSYTKSGIVYHFPFKYKSAKLNDPVTEYSVVFRLGEQFLIRAEAKAMQGNLSGNNGAIEDLNVIRRRAGLLDYFGVEEKDSVLTAINHERQVELFTEWGHRWLDIKRTGQVNSVMPSVTNLKGGVWSSNWQWYPIPQTELLKSPGFKQNLGYN